MTISLLRVDDRLIHGQVVVGWGSRLHPVGYLVIDDALAVNGWEQELYAAGLDADVEASFVPVAEGAGAIRAAEAAEGVWVVLFQALAAAWEVARAGALRGMRLNLGGIHGAEGREPVLDYIHLAPRDRELLQEIRGFGVEVSARELPDSASTSLESLLS